jgi:hypothetical protein
MQTEVFHVRFNGNWGILNVNLETEASSFCECYFSIFYQVYLDFLFFSQFCKRLSWCSAVALTRNATLIATFADDTAILSSDADPARASERLQHYSYLRLKLMIISWLFRFPSLNYFKRGEAKAVKTVYIPKKVIFNGKLSNCTVSCLNLHSWVCGINNAVFLDVVPCGSC